MNPSRNQLYQELLDLFRQHDAKDAYGLIERIMVKWGYEIAHRELPPPSDFESRTEYRWRAQWITHSIFQSIDDRGYPGPRERMKDPGKQLTIQEIEGLAARWAAQLAQLPFDDTRESFAAAVHEWFLTCDLRGFDESGLELSRADDRAAVTHLLSTWGIALGVY